MHKKPTKIIVIGSNCFTGSHIVNRLLQDPNNLVVGVSRSPEKASVFLPYRQQNLERFRFVQLDVVCEFQKIKDLMDAYRPEIIINVAALSEVFQSHLTPEEYFEINTTAVVRLTSHLKDKIWLKKFIHISSAEIYGPCSEPVDESAPLNPTTPYAVSKAAADQYLLTARKNAGFPVTLIRSTNVYGPGQQLFKVIPRSVINLTQGKPIELHGGGVVVRPFIHIHDVVDGIVAVLEKENAHPIYNFSVSDTFDIATVVKKICDVLGKDFNSNTTVVSRRPEQDSKYLLDCRLAEQELNWRPKISLEEGLRTTSEWLWSNLDKLLEHPLKYVHVVRVDKAASDLALELPVFNSKEVREFATRTIQ